MYTNCLWDILPGDIQLTIQEISSIMVIQEIFRYNRNWYFLRRTSLKKLRPNYKGKGYRTGDRVLMILKNKKNIYGTIDDLQNDDYHSRISALDGKKLYYYLDRKDKPEDIIALILLNSWECCMCHLCKLCVLCLINK